MVTAKSWTGAARFGMAALAFAMAAAPLTQLQAEAPAAAAADAKLDQARVDKGRETFVNWGCTACHSLADADSHGDIGPSLDGSDLTEAFIVGRVTNGQGAMPGFGGQLTDEEIADLAYYIAHVQKK